MIQKSSGEINQSRPLAVRDATNETGREALNRYLSAPPAQQSVRFETKDDDELNSELSAGRFGRVLFADLDALQEMMWKHHADLNRWQNAGVEIVLANEPATNDWRDLIHSTYASYARHRAAQARRQTIAATLLSLVAIASIGALLILR